MAVVSPISFSQIAPSSLKLQVVAQAMPQHSPATTAGALVVV